MTVGFRFGAVVLIKKLVFKATAYAPVLIEFHSFSHFILTNFNQSINWQWCTIAYTTNYLQQHFLSHKRIVLPILLVTQITNFLKLMYKTWTFVIQKSSKCQCCLYSHHNIDMYINITRLHAESGDIHVRTSIQKCSSHELVLQLVLLIVDVRIAWFRNHLAQNLYNKGFFCQAPQH